MTIVPVEVTESGMLRWGSLAETLSRLQFWRLFTPALLHFNTLHLLFNLLWVWELGRRIEYLHGWASFWVITTILAVSGNLAQYLVSSDSYLFGGLSGVVYGYLGFVLLGWRLVRFPAYRLRREVVILMLVLLVFFSTNITAYFGLYIANAAHWGGFVTGMALALGWYSRSGRQPFRE